MAVGLLCERTAALELHGTRGETAHGTVDVGLLTDGCARLARAVDDDANGVSTANLQQSLEGCASGHEVIKRHVPLVASWQKLFRGLLCGRCLLHEVTLARDGARLGCGDNRRGAAAARIYKNVFT